MEYMNYYMQLLDIDCKGTTFFLDIQTYVYKKGWHVYKKDLYLSLGNCKSVKVS
jgi:hypothetical protein